MAENDNPQTDPQEEPHGTDWKAESRKWEERSKANRAELDALKAQLDEVTAKQAEQADAADRAAKAEAEVERMRVEIERRDTVSRVSEAKGVPASLLHGADEGELSASADAVLEFARSRSLYPEVEDGGSQKAPADTKESISAIKDRAARVRARAENAGLYK